MDTKEQQANFWKAKGPTEAERYWKTERHRKRRKWFAARLKRYDFESIYEVGCNSGRNLWYVENKLPGKRLGGLDINSHAINLAREMVPQAEFHNIDICDMDVEDKYDIVFTSGVLLHIPPSHIYEVIEKCIQKANKYVMHMETQGPDEIINGPKELHPTKKVSDRFRCTHNYIKIYKKLGLKAKYKTAWFGEEDARHLIVVKV